MFRKDGGRTAASTDVVRLPLKLAWSKQSLPVAAGSTISTSVVREKTIYYIAATADGRKSAQRRLFAADAESGAVRWSQLLAPRRMHPFSWEDIGPAVTAQGKVYVGDLTIKAGTKCIAAAIKIAAFADGDGHKLGETQVPIKNDLSRLFLMHGHGDDTYLGSNDTLLTSAEKPDG